MEVVSTLHLVFSGTEKTNDYAVKGQYEYEAKHIQIWSYLLFHDSRNVKKHPKKHETAKQQNQNQPAIS